jgi:DNA-binding NarL/FixJ family response regulator
LETLRILVAEDHPLFRKGMISLLSSVPEFEVVGEAATGGEAVARAAQLQPDVILMDLQMPEVNGIEATRRILQESPNVRVLVVTLLEDDDSVFLALRAGARGYVLKDADEEEMVLAIRAVGRGEAIFSPTIATRVLVEQAACQHATPFGLRFSAYLPLGSGPVAPRETTYQQTLRRALRSNEPHSA